MKNDGQKPRANGAFRAFSSYLRIVSSGASTVASTVRSAASAIVDRDNDVTNDQVLWAGYDKLEWDGCNTRQVLLLAYRSGFQVWDVEEADNVRNLVSRHDGAVSFVQVLPKPITSKKDQDIFAKDRPLLAVCADAFLLSGGGSNIPSPITNSNRTNQNCSVPLNGGFMPSVVWFYSMRSQSFLHVLKFRSAIYSVRCSTRVVAIAQAAQIHCLDAATLEKEYTILTNPIDTGCIFGGIGYGPLAVGTRWLAYSGSPVAVSNSGRVNPQQLTSNNATTLVSNGSLVAHYAKESSKQLAAGIVTLGDFGYKKLTSYYSELVPDGNISSQKGNLGSKPSNGHLPDTDNVGMVIVRDIVMKSPIAQFRAHKSPISSLCFDPSGTLLVTASVQGHNINVFRIMPKSSSTSDSGPSYIHLYTLQRGVTNAVIQDVSFSDDSHWIMISSSRGTNHLFAISPFGGPVDFISLDSTLKMFNNQQNMHVLSPPIALSAISRIRSGNSGWKSTVGGAAAAAAGNKNTFSAAIASVFHNCKVHVLHNGTLSLNPTYHVLVFSSGSMVQYVMRASIAQELGPGSYGSDHDSDVGLVVEPMQKWDICRKHIRREREDNTDIYGENGNSERSKVFPENIEEDHTGYPKGKEKINTDEKHHMYIAEAELQMHEARIPLWAKSEIYFHCMTNDGDKMDEGCGRGGEFEIERIPTRAIEVKSKHLVPVFDHLQTPKFQPPRSPDLGNTTNRQLVHQISENGILSSRGSASSLDSMGDGGNPITTTAGWEGLHGMPIDTMNGSVDSSNHNLKSNTRLDFVNNRASLTAETHINLVKNYVEGQKLENQVQEDGNEFD